MSTNRNCLESARRHSGVALIDLTYAAADLERSMADAEPDHARLALLIQLRGEIDRLRQLCAALDAIAEPSPGWVAAHWPHLVRRNADLHSGRN